MPRAAKTVAMCARSELERAALSHPAFVHHSAETVLDHVSSGLFAANREVPFGSPDIAYRAAVFAHIALLLEVHCCLCGKTRRANSFRTSLPFCKWLCGDFDATAMSGARTHPLCINCTGKVVIFSAGKNATGWGAACQPVVTEAQYPELLCAFYADRDFRKRVAESAGAWRLLRFDPRRPQLARAA